MGFLDKLKRSATKAVDEHGDKVSKAIDKAAGIVDKKTKGKYTDKVESGRGKAKDALDKLDGKDDNDLGRQP
jgi:hypothetical protein